MSHPTRVREALEALSRLDAPAQDAAIAAIVRAWLAKQLGSPVYIADSDDFSTQFGDDYRGAAEMADRMNEFAAYERDSVLKRISDAFEAPSASDASAASRLSAAPRTAPRTMYW